MLTKVLEKAFFRRFFSRLFFFSGLHRLFLTLTRTEWRLYREATASALRPVAAPLGLVVWNRLAANVTGVDHGVAGDQPSWVRTSSWIRPRTVVSTAPNQLSPCQVERFWARGSSFATPIPQIVSLGLASTSVVPRVSRSVRRRSGFWVNFA